MGGVPPAETAVTPTETPAPPRSCQKTSTQQPCDPRPFFANYVEDDQLDQFAWDLFLYVNWPAQEGNTW